MQLEFFRGIPLERESIALTLTPEGRPKGEAYVDFPTEESQKEALGRHKEAMGERYIELFLSTKANMVQVGALMGLHPIGWSVTDPVALSHLEGSALQTLFFRPCHHLLSML